MGIEWRAGEDDGAWSVVGSARRAWGDERAACWSGGGGRGRGGQSLPVQVVGAGEVRAGQTAPVAGAAPSAQGRPRGGAEDHWVPPPGGARFTGDSGASHTIWPRWQTGHTRSETPVSAS